MNYCSNTTSHLYSVSCHLWCQVVDSRPSPDLCLPPHMRPFAFQVLFLSNSLREQKRIRLGLFSHPPRKSKQYIYIKKHIVLTLQNPACGQRNLSDFIFVRSALQSVLVKEFIESGALRMEDKLWRIPVVLQIKAGRKIRGKPGDLGFIRRTQHGRFPSYCNPLQFEHPQNTHNSNFTWDFQGPIYEQQSAREYKIPFYDPRKPDKESHSS